MGIRLIVLESCTAVLIRYIRWYGTTQVKKRIHLYSTLVMVQPYPRIQLEAELDSAAVKGIDYAIDIKSGRLFFIQLSRTAN